MTNESLTRILQFFLIPAQINFSDHILFISLVSFALILTLIKLVRTHSLLESILYLSLFSLIICVIYLLLDSPDVAMTEAAIGVCISTVILLVVLPKIGAHLPINNKNVVFSILTTGVLVYLLLLSGKSIIDYGSEAGPLHQHAATKHYIENTEKEIGINSIVAAILASYRGFDTLGETLVIFTAGIIVTLILSYRRKNVEKP